MIRSGIDHVERIGEQLIGGRLQSLREKLDCAADELSAYIKGG